MKAFFTFVIFTCLVFPAFSQSANRDRFESLGNSIDWTVESSNNKLADYDDMISDDGNVRTYSNYKVRYESLSKALRESEARLDLLIRTNDRSTKIKDERDRYESLIRQLEDLQSGYDSWLKNAR